MLITNALLWIWTDDRVTKIAGGAKLGWIRFDNGRIAEMSTDPEQPPPAALSGEEIVDAGGSLVIPGLCDSHIHVSMTGESSYFLDLKDCPSIADMKSKLQLHMERNPSISFVQGVNWDQDSLGRYPTRYDLDEVTRGVPVFLWRACWHIGVANSEALTRAGILNGAPAPHVEGGKIDLDADTGEVSGILRERAVELMVAVMGKKTEEEKMKFLQVGLDICSSKGITSVQSNDERCVAAYQALQASGTLKTRVFLTPMHDEVPELVAMTTRPPKNLSGVASGSSDLGDPSSFLLLDRVKLFTDGSLGAETAALRPTGGKDDAGSGILVHSNEILVDKVRCAVAAGLRLEMHAIGDRAADQVLGALEEVAVDPAQRPIMTHCQILGADLVTRMKARGVVANVQPAFVPTDMKWVSERIHPSRQAFAYAWRSLLQEGIVVAGGSDAPVEPCSPLLGMHDAIFRTARPPDRTIYRPEECLSFAEALWMYTVGGALAAQCEDVLGKLRVGYAADVVMLPAAVLTQPTLLKTASPTLVIVGGRVMQRATPPSMATTVHTQAEERVTPGLFVPGKNGARPSNRFRCACVLEGKAYLCSGL